ncbi:MAG: hypothetical protein WA610_04250 [Thermodesulfovibrionales bacterium]
MAMKSFGRILAVLMVAGCMLPVLTYSADIEIDGDLQLNTLGNGLVFPDASKQTTAFSALRCTTVYGLLAQMNSAFTSSIATCPAGTYPLSGGFTIFNWVATNTACFPIENWKNGVNTWKVAFQAPNATDCAFNSYYAHAICCP